MNGVKKYDEQRERVREKSPKRRDMTAKKNHQPHYQHHLFARIPVGVLFCFLCQLENPGRQYALREIRLCVVRRQKRQSIYIHTPNKAHNVAAIPFHAASFFSLAILKLVHTPQTSTLYSLYRVKEKTACQNGDLTFSPSCAFSLGLLVRQRNITTHINKPGIHI